MSIFKKLILLFPAFVILVMARPVIAAENLIVSCNKPGSCVSNNSGPLFEKNSLYPGETYQRTIEVINNSEEACDIDMDINGQTQEADLNDRIFTKITSGENIYFGQTQKSLQDLFIAGGVDLSHVDSGDSKVFLWEVLFDPNAGNEYQGSSTSFNFDLDFSCNKPGGGGGGDSVNSETNQSDSGLGGQVAGIFTSLGFGNNDELGQNNQDNESLDESSTIGILNDGEGDVKGSTTCSGFDIYLPYILLALQVLLQLVIAHLYRGNKKPKFGIFWITIGLSSLVLYFFLKKPECYFSYFWILSILASIITRFFGNYISRQ